MDRTETTSTPNVERTEGNTELQNEEADQSGDNVVSFNAMLIISLSCMGALLVHLLLEYEHGELKKLDEIALGLIVLGLLPWLAGILSSAKVGGLEFKFLKARVSKQGGELDTLKFLVVHFLSGPERNWLNQFANEEVFEINTDHFPEEFKAEIRHLRALGFIDNFKDKGLRLMYSGPPGTRNVREHFHITESGRTYLELRRKMTGD